MVTASEILNAKILIVDDHEANVQLLEHILRSAGYLQVSSTTNPRAVCDLYREHRHDALLLDLKMPHMDGFQVMEALKAIDPDGYLPVLVITAEPDHKLRALDAGARDFLTKPFDPVEVLTRTRNILEARLLHQQLHRNNRELEAFSYSVSHDLRAPLRAVTGYATMLREDFGRHLPHEAQRLIQVICSGALRMGDLIDHLLTFSRVGHQGIRKQSVDTESLVREIVGDLASEAQPRQVEVRIGSCSGCVGDRALIRQVWTNLLANAFKFTRAREQAVIEIDCYEDGPQMVYRVKDNGVGFDPAYADKLFQVFQRLHGADQFEGTGIGLSIVQRVIERHGGRVWAEGAPGAGATFCFSLPNASAGAA